MHEQSFVNLAVADLPKSKAFFGAPGLSFNPRFTNDQGACLVLGENIFAMLLAKDFFKGFTDKALVDARSAAEALLCLSCESRAGVDALVAKAVAAGSRAPRAAGPRLHGRPRLRGPRRPPPGAGLHGHGRDAEAAMTCRAPV